ncbi:LysR substrate-binding domain-containing protein [Phyllobacterium sp. YR531]|uniref:LysR substrate-binding domain-containing protein n=1 Tax=Phyllobacterium sp. YR531 TaxID=1144343 RepID=UPI00026F751B|nr:LysR substrate-binding domain-containing protein [Phyllobacterium sp. YR531]EJN05193.1 transcriptional regulator [Phyllobacterium sp. YR531]
MRFDLVDLKLFLHVAEAGSITAGAERSGLALASASARIKGMEEMLGIALVERKRRGVTLTAAGQTLVYHARTIQNQIETMAGDLGEHARGLRAHIRLLANTAAGSRLSDILARFLANNRNIDVELEEWPSHVIAEKLANSQADLGIAAGWANLSNLEQKPFCRDQLAVITAKESDIAKGFRSIRFEDILAEPFVGLGSGNALQEHVIRQASRLGRHLNFRVKVASLEAACQLVASQVGIAIVSQAAASRSAVVRNLRIVPLSNEWATRHLQLCAKCFSDLTPQAKLLADELERTANAEGFDR